MKFSYFYIFLTIILFTLSNSSKSSDEINTEFLSLKDVAIYGAKNYECGEYHLSWIALLVTEKHLLKIKNNENLDDESFNKLRSVVEFNWKESDQNQVNCTDAKKNILNAYNQNKDIKKLDRVKDYDNFIKLKSSRKFFGIILKDDIENYKIIKKDIDNTWGLGANLRVEIEPPTINPIFSGNVTIYRHPNIKNSNIIQTISKIKQSYENYEITIDQLSNIIDYYIKNDDANFIADVIKKDNLIIPRYHLNYNEFKKYKLTEEDIGFSVVIEFNDTDEQIIMNTYKFGLSNILQVTINLVEDSKKITNSLSGL